MDSIDLNNLQEPVGLEEAKHPFRSFIRKWWKLIFVKYERWWWLGIVLVVVLGIFFNRDYIPVVFPEFGYNDIDHPLEFEQAIVLTVFYPPKLIQGRETKLTFAFKSPDNPPANLNKYRFELEADWPGVQFDPKSFEFPARQTGFLQIPVKLTVLNANIPRSVTITVAMIEPTPVQPQDPIKFEIEGINRPEYLIPLITILGGGAAIVTKLLWPVMKLLFAKVIRNNS